MTVDGVEWHRAVLAAQRSVVTLTDYTQRCREVGMEQRRRASDGLLQPGPLHVADTAVSALCCILVLFLAG